MTGNHANAASRARRSRSGPSMRATARCARRSRIGFCILFAFIGTFTYVNFVLVGPPLSLGMMSLGLRLFRLPAVDLHHAAGRARASAASARGRTLWAGLALAGAGLPLLLAPILPPVLAGLALVGVGTFLAQATATGFVEPRGDHRIAARPAASISPATSSAASSAARCSAKCSRTGAGRRPSVQSGCRLLPPARLRSGSARSHG